MAGVLMLLAMVPPAAATHGDAAVYARDDGSVVRVGRYLAGGGNTQTWQFFVVVGGPGVACNAFGSIEVGFTGSCIVTSGTGHFHPYPNTDGPDVHDVSVNGAPGKVVVN